MFSVIKSWIDEKTRKKISLFGGNYYEYLNEYIDED